MNKKAKRKPAKSAEIRDKTKTVSSHKRNIKRDKSTPELLLLLNSYFDRYGFYILLFLLSVISFSVFYDFIFLNKLYLFKDIGSDSINASYPHELQVAYYMQHVSLISKWSFYQGMGQNIFPFSIPDPFYFFLVIGGPNHLAYGIVFMEIAKIFCAGIFFYLFLRKIHTYGYAAVIGGVLYSFSAFIILGSCWNIFSTEAVYLALLLYAFEKLYQDNKIFLFPVAICLVAINQPLDLFLMGLFLTAYILFRYLTESPVFKVKEVLFIFLKVAVLGLLGICISSFFFLGNVVQMIESPRVGGDAAFFNKLRSAPVFGFEGKDHYVTALMRFFSSDIMGTGSNFSGWYNYLEAPLFYAGLIIFLLIPQLFQFLDKKRKIIFFSFILLFLLPVIFPFFRYAFWLFTGNYYRIYSFFVAVSFLLCSIIALNNINKEFKINLKILGLSIIVLLILVNYHYFNEEVKNLVTVFLIIYTILISLLLLKKYRNIVRLAIISLIAIELIVFSNITVNDRPVISGSEFKEKTGYNDYSNEAVQYINEYDKSFFRINKEYSSGPSIYSSINDAQVQRFYGTPSYTSFNQINYINFLGEVGIINRSVENETRWAPGLSGIPFLHPFGSIKYSLTKKPKSVLLDFNYDSLTTIGDVEILKNKYSLPLGFTYDKFIGKRDFRKLSNNQKPIVLFKAFVYDDSSYGDIKGFSRFQPGDTSVNFTWQEYANDISNLKKDTLNMEEFNQNLIKGKINVNQQKLLFFSIPFDKGWMIKIDNKKVKPIIANIGFTGIMVGPGEHKIELSFIPRFYSLGAIISCLSLIVFLAILLIKYFIDRKGNTINKKIETIA
jgi:uncharacterized membrane protein YfhO